MFVLHWNTESVICWFWLLWLQISLLWQCAAHIVTSALLHTSHAFVQRSRFREFPSILQRAALAHTRTFPFRFRITRTLDDRGRSLFLFLLHPPLQCDVVASSIESVCFSWEAIWGTDCFKRDWISIYSVGIVRVKIMNNSKFYVAISNCSKRQEKKAGKINWNKRQITNEVIKNTLGCLD